MKTMTATQVSRNFSAVLDEVAGGETVRVTRDGRELAVISPTHRANGAAVKKLMDSLPDDPQYWDAVEQAHEDMNQPWPLRDFS